MKPALSLSRRALLAGGTVLALTAGLAWRPRNAVAEPADEVCIVAPLQPWSPASGLAIDAPRPLPADARCPVCGMFPARAPQWAAQAIFDDGATQYLDSPLSLLRWLHELPRHVRGRPADTLRAMYVTDTGAGPGHWLSARRAWYVRGSDLAGPMRSPNRPAWASQADARAFCQRHGGSVQTWDELLAHPQDWLDDAHRHRA